jgi:uncharacterized protein (TIGR02265 family)
MGATAHVEDLDFSSTFEALFVKVYGSQITPELRDRLREVGLDLDRPLLPAYPRRVFAGCCALLAHHAHPELPLDEALRTMGRRTVEGMSKTMLGAAVMGVFKLLGVRRSLPRLTHMFRSGDNYTRGTFEFVGEQSAEVRVSQVNGQPAYTLGLLEAGMDWVGAKEPRVRLLRREGDAAVYLLEWRES